MSKLSRICDGIMEASWLVVIMTVPVLFNVQADRAFEFPKIIFTRVFVLLMLAAWILKLVDGWRKYQQELKSDQSIVKVTARLMLIKSIALFVVLVILSTIFSVAPRLSFWGSYHRVEGAYTLFAYVLFFVVLVANLRYKVQIERLISAMIISSIPVVAYSMLQWFGVDPLVWDVTFIDVSQRMAANLGNPIFLAAYMILVFPLTLLRFLHSGREFMMSVKSEGEKVIQSLLSVLVYLGIMIGQLMAVYVSGSRGPLLGLLASGFFMSLLFSGMRRKKWLIGVIAVLAVGLTGLIMMINVENSAVSKFAEHSGLARLGRLFDPGESYTLQIRSIYWEAASEIVMPHEALDYPDGSADKFNFLRPIIGHGPDTMIVAYNRFYPVEVAEILGRMDPLDRFHNAFWDNFAVMGVLGAGVYILIFSSIFYHCLIWLEMIIGHRHKIVFWGMYLGFGLLGAFGMSFGGGIGFLGVGIPLGLLAGISVFILWRTLIDKKEDCALPQANSKNMLLIVLLAVIIAHFVELSFGITTATSRIYFWSAAGMMLLVGMLLPNYEGSNQKTASVSSQSENSESRISKSSGKKKSRSARMRKSSGKETKTMESWLYRAMINGLILTAPVLVSGFSFVTNRAGGNSALKILWNSLAKFSYTRAVFQGGVLVMMFLLLLLGAWILISSEKGKVSSSEFLKSFAVVFTIPLVLGGIFWLWMARILLNVSRFSAMSAADFLSLVSKIGNMYLILILWMGGVILLLSWLWTRSASKLSGAGAGETIGLGVLLLALWMFFAYTSNLRFIYADIAYKNGNAFLSFGEVDAAEMLFERAVELAPKQASYYTALAQTYYAQANGSGIDSESTMMIEKSEDAFLKAQSLNPLEVNHTADLGLYYLRRIRESDQHDSQLSELVDKADQYFAIAANMHPYGPKIWLDWASLKLGYLGESEEAIKFIKHAAEFGTKSSLTGMEALLIEAYTQTGQAQEALDVYQEALANSIMFEEEWRVELAVANAFSQLQQVDEAVIHAQRALDLAPEDMKGEVQYFIEQMEG